MRCRLSHLTARTRSGLKADSSLILICQRVRALCSRPFCADSKAVSLISLQTILTEPAAKEDPNYASHKHRHGFTLTFAVSHDKIILHAVLSLSFSFFLSLSSFWFAALSATVCFLLLTSEKKVSFLLFNTEQI